MIPKNGYTGNSDSGKNDPLNRFIHGSVTWKKSKEEVWKNILSSIDEPVQRKINFSGRFFFRYAAAALILLLLGFTSFLRFYSKTYTTEYGQQLEIILPDGSKTNLNAGTTIKYMPYWWKFSRKVELEGEAFFDVTKGDKLEIISKQGKTIVLGTSINILSFNNTYEVTCINGIVKVVAASSKDEVILKENQKAFLARSGMLEIEKRTDTKESTAWTRGEFYFTSVPLNEVFKKIEKSYGIKIKYSNQEKLIYTGYFKKDNNVENVLNLVCMAFGIKFEKISDCVYQISNNE